MASSSTLNAANAFHAPFYKRKRYVIPLVFLALLVWGCYGIYQNAVAKYNEAPPIGTQYRIVDNSVDGFKSINDYWTRVCAMLPGGVLTQEELLFFRRDVPWYAAYGDVYETAVFRYSPPTTVPDELGRLTASLDTIPWCPAGFAHAVPIHTYKNRIN